MHEFALDQSTTRGVLWFKNSAVYELKYCNVITRVTTINIFKEYLISSYPFN